MKKLLALLLALAMVLSLTACGGGSTTETKETETAETAETAEESADAEAPADETAEAPAEDAEAETEAPVEETAEAAEGEAAVITDTPVGTYKMTAMVSDEESVDEETLAQMEAIGMVFTLQIKEDGTGALVIFGEESPFTWEGNTITVEDSAVDFTLENGILTMEQDGTSMTFQKVSDEIIDVTPEKVDYVAQAAGLSDAVNGTYYLYAMEADGESYDSDTLQMLSAMGMTCALLLKEDGTGSLYLFGTAVEIGWTDSAITMEGEEIAYTLADHIITFEQDGTKMQFIKTSDEIEDIPVVDFSEGEETAEEAEGN